MEYAKPSEWVDNIFQYYLFRNPSNPSPTSGINMLVCHNWFRNSRRMRVIHDGTLAYHSDKFAGAMLFKFMNKYYITNNIYYTLENYQNGFELIGCIFIPKEAMINPKFKPLESIAPGIVTNDPKMKKCMVYEMKPIWFGHDPLPYSQVDPRIYKVYQPILDLARGEMLAMKIHDMRD